MIVTPPALIVTYHVFFLATIGRTPGKALFGLRVYTFQGKNLSIWRALIRTISYSLSLLTFGLGFLWVLADNRRQALHDKLAGSCVVYHWEARSDERFLVEATRRLSKDHDVPHHGFEQRPDDMQSD